MNKQKIYDAYVENWHLKHGTFQKPEIHSMWTDKGEELGRLIGDTITVTGKYPAHFRLGKYLRGQYNSNIVETVSGRIIEVGADNRGCHIYVEWESMEDATTYDSPTPFFMYFETWAA